MMKKLEIGQPVSFTAADGNVKSGVIVKEVEPGVFQAKVESGALWRFKVTDLVTGLDNTPADSDNFTTTPPSK